MLTMYNQQIGTMKGVPCNGMGGGDLGPFLRVVEK